MNRFLFVSAVCMQIGWISGMPHPEGVGAYAYQDSNGHRYGGTYGLKDDNAGHHHPGLPGFVPFGPDFDDFFPEYFRNFENLLQDRRARSLLGPPHFSPRSLFQQFSPLRHLNYMHRHLTPFRPFPKFPSRHNRAFHSNKEYQRKALDTAKKAYDVTSNQAGFMPNYDFSRFSSFGANQFPNFGMGMGQNTGYGNFGAPNGAYANRNAAMAVGIAAPGFTHQFAGLSPPNSNNPNINVSNRFAETNPSNGFMSVSSSSFSSSSNVDGKQQNHRHAETVVNNNGKVTHYKVED